ncbi:MarR family winged helix-turn-helix transcriptional regulator [Niabella hibiscisoli]|uniref:MarR family winged helix-turn-helix transcriptional regulator n=1 Tax=Niabella hibiscisoli TaxID=1825928 RepID=UPI001F0F94E7|nr:MarR family winged helix-turn-helix transcriptional regulator [Niabella hibiscisoli]MCH5715134.1 MarR family winged helix-turn-helix transcriptional regulator [Niabella hibiscisoli]
MNSIQLLKVLLEKLEAYESTVADKEALTLAGMIDSINEKQDLTELKNSFISAESGPFITEGKTYPDNIERVIAQHFLFLYRYIKFYAKTALAGTTINTIEEFGMLATAMQQHAISKTELIRKNVIEKSSGIEIVKRLIKAGYMTQSDNPDDHRSQLMTITPNGRQALFSAFQKMDVLGIIAAGNLADAEKYQLANLLKKLDQFHFDNYNNKQLHSLEDYMPDCNRDYNSERN